MDSRTTLVAVSASLLIAGAAVSAGDASAQGSKSLAGTYSSVAVKAIDASGKASDIFGPNQRGLMVLTADGRYMILITRSSLPKIASNSRLKSTAEENQAIVTGSISHFGKYTVDEKAKTITFNVEVATFPNWEGGAQTRPFTLAGDLLTYKVAAVSGGTGSGEVSWRRVK